VDISCSQQWDTNRFSSALRVFPATTGNGEEQHIQPIRKKEKVKADSDWQRSAMLLENLLALYIIAIVIFSQR
jgi:hypothetical protein